MTDTDIFGKQVPVLIRNVSLNGKIQEIYLDGTGMIGAVGEKITDHDAEFIINGDKATALPGMPRRCRLHSYLPYRELRRGSQARLRA